MTIIGTKWVYRNKLDENGIVSQNKARLVAQGYNQQEGIDYDETYASVARLESIRILLAYAYAIDFKLFQMDVKSTFLNDFINEEHDSVTPHEGVGLRVVDSHAGNHPKGGITPFETIRRLLVVIGRSCHSGFKGETFEPKRKVDSWLTFQKSVRVFDDPILFLAGLKPLWEFGQQRPAIIMGGKEMAFRNFIYSEDDDDLAFLLKEPSPGFGIGSPSASVNTKPPKDVEEPEVLPAKVTADSRESSKAGVPLVKRKLAFESLSSRVVRAKTSASKDDAPFLSISNDDEGLSDSFELKDANAYHLKISAMTSPTWRGHLDNKMDLELLDLHDYSYAQQAVVDNANHVVLALREKISSLTADVKEHKDKAKLKAVEMSLCEEVVELKQDRRDVVLKVIPYAAMDLVHSDELGSLAGKLVSSAITYECCRAYKQVAAINEPFDLSKVEGYCSSYQKDHTQASNDFAAAMFPWLDEFVADATAPIEALLSKKPPTLQKPAPSRTKMPAPSSQKATPSSAPSVNLISPSPDLLKPFLTPLERRQFIFAMVYVGHCLNSACQLFLLFLDGCPFLRAEYRDALPPFIEDLAKAHEDLGLTPELHRFCNSFMHRWPIEILATQRSHDVKKDLLYTFPQICLYCGTWIMIFLAYFVSSGNNPLSRSLMPACLVRLVSCSGSCVRAQLCNLRSPLAQF
ncbi:probable xyloglucan endotransglucosylase/hydrolase protein 30 [Tanacetum coccineum]